MDERCCPVMQRTDERSGGGGGGKEGAVGWPSQDTSERAGRRARLQDGVPNRQTDRRTPGRLLLSFSEAGRGGGRVVRAPEMRGLTDSP